MKKILVPTDFSTCATAAEDFAFMLAKKIQAELIYIHVVITPVDWIKLTKDQENFFPETKAAIAKAKDKLNDLVDEAEKAGLSARKILVYNDGNEKIHKYVASEHIDLVVMGSHGQYGFRDHILGSNTYSMLRRSDVPVFVIKENNPKMKLESLVFATNFKEDTGESFKTVEKLSEELGVKLKVLFVNTPTYFMETNDILSIGKSYLKEFGNYSYDIHIIDAFKEERGILQFAEKSKADGIALVTSGKSDLMQYFSPSVTENLIAMTDLPVISIRKPKK
ncbi:universal stress protein [Cecembia calidifontis]|uniref:Nucleotide-binding universal stress UspA family protein n=1 Tax=Cecembia calidifontis TaxID=1187080 RepID=A0A4Q7PDI4_9BACT|nr:universal stress protein [Cecembia calidifontis]RZS97680.1 nucleotide-binding universal stress UspA family protein [Cecembia calidifontis]